MKILALECSASAASAAVSENGKILSSVLTNINVTHSQTLMPSAEFALKNAGVTLSDIDAFAVSAGPGSFTGIRIGISAVKGMAISCGKPCIGVSTLEAMAYSHRCAGGIICCVMDARCMQVYNALFRTQSGKIERLTPDRAVTCEELSNELKQYSETITVVGDGAAVFAPFAPENAVMALGEERYQNACGVAAAAEDIYNSGGAVSVGELQPIYLRLPQAQRELKAKQEEQK